MRQRERADDGRRQMSDDGGREQNGERVRAGNSVPFSLPRDRPAIDHRSFPSPPLESSHTKPQAQGEIVVGSVVDIKGRLVRSRFPPQNETGAASNQAENYQRTR